jgi:hypothetical protein
MESEKEIIDLLELINYDVNYTYDKGYFMEKMTLSLLSYLIIHRLDVSVVKHKLIRWLIEHGANVNFNITVHTLWGLKSNTHTTILSEAIQLLLNTKLPEFTVAKLSLRVLYEFYNCVYTLVLLLSRKADLTKEFTTGTVVKTPLSILLDNPPKIDLFLEICSHSSVPLDTLHSLFDVSSQAVYHAHKDIIERVLTKLKFLVVPFGMFLTIKATPIPSVLTDLNIKCVTAISQIRGQGTVVWMKQRVSSDPINEKIPEDIGNKIEEAFNRGDNTLVLNYHDLGYVGMHYYDFYKMTMTTEYNRSKRRIWRHWQPEEKDKSEDDLSKWLYPQSPDFADV